MSKKKIALVTGSSGQDGSYLCEFLLKKKYTVIAADRRSSRDSGWRHKELGIQNNLIYEDFDLSDITSIVALIKKYKFDEVYNLAAQSFVKSSFVTPISSSDVTGIGPLRILDTLKYFSPKTKFYQASTSEMYGEVETKLLNEKSRFNPRSPYAVAKLFAHGITKNYRDSYGMFCCSGILFNHESPLRGEEFVTRKITKQLCEISLGQRKFIELGNIYSKRDWGYAKDYVEGMWKMLQQKKPEDFVLATNTVYSVKYFLNECFKALNFSIEWRGKGLKEVAIDKKTKKIILKINPRYYRPAEVEYLKGSYKKAYTKLNWKPRVSLSKLINLMIEADLKRLKKN